jgi:hypothetical protein
MAVLYLSDTSAMRPFQWLTALLMASGLCACVSTELPPKPMAPQFMRLNSLSSGGIRLNVVSKLSSPSAGHQYLLVIIPFGSVSVPSPEQRVWNASALKLALAGVRIVPAGDERAQALTITIEELRVNAFDLLVTRHVSARVRISALWHGTNLSAEGSQAEFRRVGFGPQLEDELDRAVSIAVDSVLEQTGLVRKGRTQH